MRTIIASLVGIIAIAMMSIFLATAANANDDIRIWHTERLHTSNALRDWLARNMIDGKWGILDTGEERYRHNNLITGAIDSALKDGWLKLPPNNPPAREALKHELAARWEMPLSGDIARKTFEANALDLPGAKIRGYYFPKNWVYRAPTTHTSTAKPTTVATVTPTHEADIPKLVLHIRGIHDRLRNADARNATANARLQQEVEELVVLVEALKKNDERHTSELANMSKLLSDMNAALIAVQNGAITHDAFNARLDDASKALEESEERLNQRIDDVRWAFIALAIGLLVLTILMLMVYLRGERHTKQIVKTTNEELEQITATVNNLEERFATVESTAATAKTTAESADAKASRALDDASTAIKMQFGVWSLVGNPPSDSAFKDAKEGTTITLEFVKETTEGSPLETKIVTLTREEGGFRVDGIASQRNLVAPIKQKIFGMLGRAFRSNRVQGVTSSNGDPQKAA